MISAYGVQGVGRRGGIRKCQHILPVRPRARAPRGITRCGPRDGRRCLVPIARSGPTRDVAATGLTPPAIYIINANSLAKPHALEQLSAELIGYKSDIAIVTETHLKTKHHPNIIKVAGFQLFRRDRLGRCRGGVAVLVRDDYDAAEVQLSGDDRILELMWIRVVMHGGVVMVGALYHPPHPIYPIDLLFERLESTVETLTRENPGALIVLGGDFNKIEDARIVEITGMVSLVHQPTRGPAILDRLFASEECFSSVKVLASAVKSDHRAIIAVPSGPIIGRKKTRRHVVTRRRSPQQHAALLNLLNLVDFSALKEESDAQAAWDLFYSVTGRILDTIYPIRKVTMISADPQYYTPSIKLLLRRKNRLMRAGRLEEASACARRVGREIERVTSAHLRDIDPRHGLRDLWRSVDKVTGRQSNTERSSGISAEEFNQHYAAISTDPGYNAPIFKATAASNREVVTEAGIFHMLDHLHHTAEGRDGLPAWFLRLSAPVLSGILAHLMNQSFAQTHVPTQWKTSIIHPVAKIDQPRVPADFRPISITPVLSRLLERIIVQTYIYPSFTQSPMDGLLTDQFAHWVHHWCIDINSFASYHPPG